MPNDAAKARLTEFLADLREDQFQFQTCDEVGINTRGCTGDAPLKIAVVRDDVQIVTDLLDAGADPNIPGEDDCTPLHHAASHGRCSIIRLLLAHGASTSVKDTFGHTPADIARILQHDDALALLTE
jgi:ankyrin repeat protein